jgi:alkylation response protein AidB-like acyl-CoA dehydrogenase
MIYEIESARFDAPEGLGKIARLMGPTVIEYGTAEQRAAILPGILSGEDVWCQGYSEPEAGSDLAGVRTRALRDGGSYLLSGTKVWTTYAQYADRCFLLARTDPDAEKHAGLTLFLLDMSLAGIDVRPIRQITGSSEFCEVFLSDVRVSSADILGGIGNGWRVVSSSLKHERGASLVFRRLMKTEQHFIRFQEQAAELAADPTTLGRTAARIATIRLLAYLMLSEQLQGGDPGALGSAAKLYGSQAWQDLAEVSLVSAGTVELTLANEGPESLNFANMYLDSRCATISAGSSEIQREIIARRVLDLPKR